MVIESPAESATPVNVCLASIPLVSTVVSLNSPDSAMVWSEAPVARVNCFESTILVVVAPVPFVHVLDSVFALSNPAVVEV